MVNRSGEGGHCCLVLNYKRKDFSFSPLIMLVAVGFLCMAFAVLRYVSLLPILLRVLIMNECKTLSNVFSVSVEMTIFSPPICQCGKWGEAGKMLLTTFYAAVLGFCAP